MASSPLATTASPAVTLSLISQLFSHIPIPVFPVSFDSSFPLFQPPFCVLLVHLSLWPTIAKEPSSNTNYSLVSRHLSSKMSSESIHSFPSPFPFSSLNHSLSQYLLPSPCKMLNNLFLCFLIRFLALLKSILHTAARQNLLNCGPDAFTILILIYWIQDKIQLPSMVYKTL